MKKQLFFALLLTTHIACASDTGEAFSILTFRDTSGIGNPEYRTQTGTEILREALTLLVEKRDTEHKADLEKTVKVIREELADGRMPRTTLVRKDNVAAIMLDITKALINFDDGQPLLSGTDLTSGAEGVLEAFARVRK